MDRLTHLGFLGLRSHHEQFSSRVYHLNLSNDRSRVRCHEQFSQMVDQQLVSTWDNSTSQVSVGCHAIRDKPRERKMHRWVQNLSSQDLIVLPRLEYSVARHLQGLTVAITAHKTETDPERKYGQTNLVTILEQLEVLRFWDLERHGGGR
jgi:hypothetical protein